VIETKSNAGAINRWTLEEDAKLTGTVGSTCKKKWGKKHTIDRVAVAGYVPGRVEQQCRSRWNSVLDPNVGTVSGRKGS
jgi:hypothetical protein